MPTTKAKNMLYRVLLPFFAPRSGARPVTLLSGHKIMDPKTFVHLVKKHHILGSSTLLESGNDNLLICTSSSSPFHEARPDSVYRVASITKTATAVLTMHLAEHHVLNLDKPVSDLFLSDAARIVLEGITLRHLLSHTSGLTDPPDLETGLENGRPFTDFVSVAKRFPPGQAFHYSNLGFGLIGCVMETVLNEPVGKIFEEHLFRPLEMNATLEGNQIPRNLIMPVSRILPYHKGSDMILTRLGSVPLKNADPLRHYGHTAGSMYTDIFSLRTLFHVLTGKKDKYLNESSLIQMKNRYASYGSLSPTLSYGLGLLCIKDSFLSEGYIFGHQGFAYGCVDGAFWEEATGRILITLNGGCSEARAGRLGLSNRDFLHWAFRKELPLW